VHVLIEYNEFSNSRPRDTGNPVAPIDIVGGKRWVVRGNFIHDHEKGQGDGISYAAFLKGNSRDGLFERNLIVCELLHRGGIRLGLSFGGGGSQPDSICKEGRCSPEHRNGVMRNNVIVNCPADVGIYLDEARDSRVYNAGVVDDFCGHRRDDGAMDIGAVEYTADTCDTTHPARVNPSATNTPSPGATSPATITSTANPTTWPEATSTGVPSVPVYAPYAVISEPGS